MMCRNDLLAAIRSRRNNNATTSEQATCTDDSDLLSVPEGTTENDLPLNKDPEYQKYFKMLKMGLPMGAVQNALLRDGKDPKIMELNPDESLKSQLKAAEVSDNDPPLNEDPEYQKYFKMLKMGLPMGAVQNALIRDGKDPRILLSDSKASSALTKASRPQTNVKNSTQALKKPKVRRKRFIGIPWARLKFWQGQYGHFRRMICRWMS